ncbi:MAG: flippase [Planctomycetales bacterium]|nr:flippase [Planctomycetales bacterium]
MSAEAAQRVSRNALLLLVGTGVRMVLTLALVVYAASRLGVSGYGSYSLGVHYFELCLSLTATAVGIYLTREAAVRPRRTGELLVYALAIVTALAGVFALVLFAAGVLLNYAPQTRVALAIGSTALWPAAAASVFEATFVAKEKAGYVTLGTAVESALRMLLSIAALALGGGVRELFLVLVASRSLLALYYLGRLTSLGGLRWRFRWTGFAHYLRHWRVFAGENWLATLHASLDVIVLSIIHGESLVALYDAAYKVVRLGSVVARSYTSAVFPLMSRLASESRDALLRLSGDTLRVMLAIAAPVGVTATLLSDRIIHLLYPPEFAGAAPVLCVLVWVLALECINPFLSHTLFAQGSQRRSLQVAAVSILLNLLVTPVLAWRYGATGAAAGTLLAAVVAACCYAAFSLPKQYLVRLSENLLKVTGAGAILVLAMYVALPEAWLTALVLGACAYASALVLLRIVTPQDLRLLRGAGGAA